MLIWYWIYKDKPQEIFHSDERSLRAFVIARFDEAVELGIRHGRIVSGMWLIDEATEKDNVIRIYGAVPPGIRSSHSVYLAEQEAKLGLIRASDPSPRGLE